MRRHKKIEKTCEACGRPFQARLSDINNPKKAGRAGRYCSLRCRNLARPRKPRKSPLAPGFWPTRAPS